MEEGGGGECFRFPECGAVRLDHDLAALGESSQRYRTSGADCAAAMKRS